MLSVAFKISWLWLINKSEESKQNTNKKSISTISIYINANCKINKRNKELSSAVQAAGSFFIRAMSASIISFTRSPNST